MKECQCENTSAPRLKFIAYLQILGIILVVLGHSFHEYPDGEMGHSLWLYRLLYNVRMPMFTFVSGFLMYYTSFMGNRNVRSIGAFTANKVKRLLIPYLVLSLLTFVPRAMLSTMADDDISLSWSSFWRSLIVSDHLVIPYFWFIQMSFLLLLVTYVLILISTASDRWRQTTIWLLVGAFAALPFLEVGWSKAFAIDQVVRLGFFFMLGIAYCRYQPWVDRHLKTSSLLSMVVAGAIWIALFAVFEGSLTARIASVFGIYAFVCMARILEVREYRFLDHLQGANYMIFLLSWYVNVLTQQVLSHFVALPWWVHTALSLIGGIYIPWLGYRYLLEHPDSRWVRVAAFLLGQKIRK